MLKKCFGEQTMGRTQLFEWFSKFKRGYVLLKMPMRTDETVEQMNKFVHENRRITISEVTNMPGTFMWSVQSILKDNMNMYLL
jgi:16S rRNA C1402 (ribose-2'-O) methylase RsmI